MGMSLEDTAEVCGLWRSDFPPVLIHTNLQHMRHADIGLYNKAKAGDYEAAQAIVSCCIKLEKVHLFVKQYSDAIVVPVRTLNNRYANMLPIAYAEILSSCGMKLDDVIFQTQSCDHTDADFWLRITNRPQFSGYVKKGGKYVIVDDHVTSGTTINELRKYIENSGGFVSCATTLSASRGSTFLPILPATVNSLYRKYGAECNALLEAAGITNDVHTLTNKVGWYLRKTNRLFGYRTADSSITIPVT